MMVKFYDWDYFNKTFFKDTDGDYWEDKETHDKYHKDLDENTEAPSYPDPELELFFYADCPIEKSVGKVLELDETYEPSWIWAVEKFLNEQDDPEYYL